ncbi:MAG: hypothetical protein JSS02_35490, partial [Planctomycetes bacterium]|nr:hypothetical protein [Planctomycetota bacterium]
IDNYSIDKAERTITPGEISKLDRPKVADPWKLEGLDDTTGEVDVSKVNGMLGALDDLKIVGVRPKPKGFNPDLSLDREFVKRQADLDNLARDLSSAGFALTVDRKTKDYRLYSEQGDLVAATNKGARYLLRFGSVFLGDETEIEIGGASNKDEAKAETKEGDEAAGDQAPGKNKSKGAAPKQPSRYLFVTVSFDESLLGPKPQKPTPPEEIAAANDAAGPAVKAPEKPAEKQPEGKAEDKAPECVQPQDDKPAEPGAEDKKPAAEGDQKPDAPQPEAKPEGDNKPEADKPTADKPAAENPEADKPAAKKPDETKPEAAPAAPPKKTAEELKKEYEDALKKYQADLDAYDTKVAAGKKLVNDLNARFSGWYYVISADYFNKLHLTRKELIKEKDAGQPAGGNKPSKPEFPELDEDGKEKPDDK